MVPPLASLTPALKSQELSSLSTKTLYLKVVSSKKSTFFLFEYTFVCSPSVSLLLNENRVYTLSLIFEEFTNCNLEELLIPIPTTAVLSGSSDGAFVVISIAPEVAFLP